MSNDIVYISYENYITYLMLSKNLSRKEAEKIVLNTKTVTFSELDVNKWLDENKDLMQDLIDDGD
jgi:hypothetical protein